MDFSLSEEQQLLKDSVERFVRNDYGFDTRRALAEGDLGHGPDNWATFAELGWLAVPFAESSGGLGGGSVECMILMEAFGRGLVVEPYLHSVIVAGGLIEAAAEDSRRRDLLSGLIAGERILAFAHVEPQARFTLHDVATTAVADGDGWRLAGHKAVVFHGAAADRFVVSARTAGDSRDRSGISLFLVDRDTPGLAIRAYRTVDGLRAAEVTLDEVTLGSDALIGAPGVAIDAIEPVIDRATAAVSAEAVGIMDALYAQTLDYLKTRQQFGVPIGKFQALQHRAVDMFMACEETRSMVYMATLKLDAPAVERARAVSAAKVQVGQAGRLVGQEAVQLHGGMGVTDELIVGHYFKRLTMIDTLFGNADHHLRRFAENDSANG
ncbi:MAG: acyl-CoA dehydrogenase family protein [Alphaproteobacteria bacterium]|nr:acyl-CoA dehydrogenase family protein [Alphaproteobacteria bacterium]MDP6517258.1 acyl-CoA dehydrogenase family protein [Alphaproteobacteria bacterium]